MRVVSTQPFVSLTCWLDQLQREGEPAYGDPYSSPSRGSGVDEALEQDGGQVAFTEVGQHGDDRLAGVLGTVGDLDGRGEGGAGGDADQQTLLGGGRPGELDGFC